MKTELERFAINKKAKRIDEYIRHCPECLENSTDYRKPIGELMPIRTPSIPFHTVTMDFIVKLPPVPTTCSPYWLGDTNFENFDALLTVTDKFSKKTLLIPGNVEYEAKQWARAFLLATQLCDWGIPRVFISDRGSQFTSDFWKGLFNKMGVSTLFSTAHHPQTDGASERKNQMVEIAIRYHLESHSKLTWVEILPALQHDLNNTYSRVIGTSPNELLMGFKPSSALDLLNDREDLRLEELHVLRALAQQDARLAMDFAANDDKLRYDAKHRFLEFDVGDKVYLKLHKGYHLPGSPPRKWSQQRAGPYTVVKRVGDLAYKLNFGPKSRKHPVISITHLYPAPQEPDPYNRRPNARPGHVEVLGDDDDWKSYEIERLTQRKRVKGSYEYLVRWKGWEAHHDEWYPEELLAENAQEMMDVFDKAYPRTLVTKVVKASKHQMTTRQGQDAREVVMLPTTPVRTAVDHPEPATSFLPSTSSASRPTRNTSSSASSSSLSHSVTSTTSAPGNSINSLSSGSCGQPEREPRLADWREVTSTPRTNIRVEIPRRG
jgi:hypothetical protein